MVSDPDVFSVTGPGAVEVQWKGVQDFELLYKKLWAWFGLNDYSMDETHYEEKIVSIGKNMVIKWKGSKSGKDARHKNDYFRYDVEVDFLVIGRKPAETEYEGKKIKVDFADTKISFKAKVIRNPPVKGKKKFTDEDSFKKKIYDRYFVAQYYEESKMELYSELYEVVGLTKSFLNLFHF